MNNNKIKIFVTYKEKHRLIKSGIIEPIQTGRAIAEESFEGMIGDDTGDNISNKNNKFCELSAQYWAWKNYDKIGNPEYIGFMHYRRHFIFNNNKYKKNELGCVEFLNMNDKNYIDEISLKDNLIEEFVSEYDLILPGAIDLKSIRCLKKTKKTPRDAYVANIYLSKNDYDVMIDTVKELHPEYIDVVDKVEKGHKQYWYTMFIAKKEVFMQYCEFVFPILFELEKRLDFTGYSANGYRTLGYLGERLGTLFFEKLNQDKKLKIKETQVTFIEDIDEKKQAVFDIKPTFSENNIPIVMVSSSFFVPYFNTALTSILENMDKTFNYDFYVITKDISENTQQFIKNNFETQSISIKFILMDIPINSDYKVTKDITIETYYRIYIPQLFKNFDKILFIDSDVLVLGDVSKLYNIDLGEKAIGAVKDYSMQSFINMPKRTDKKYLQGLGIKNIYNYFNAGVLLWNLKKVSSSDTEKLLEILDRSNYICFDQDPLNMYFENDVLSIDPQWNYTTLTKKYNYLEYMPVESRKEFELAGNAPLLIHYNGRKKPWNSLSMNFSEIWWQYARKTPYYELILARLIDDKINRVGFGKYILIVMHYWNCKLMSRLTVGKKRNHYLAKMSELKESIRAYKDK